MGSIPNGDSALHAAIAVRSSAGAQLVAAGTRGCAALLLFCCCLLKSWLGHGGPPLYPQRLCCILDGCAVSSTAVLHLLGTVLATTFTPAGAIWLGVFVRT